MQAGNVAPITALQMFLNGVFEKQVFGATDTTPLSGPQKVAAACMAGAASSIIYSPVDLTMIHQQKLVKGPAETLRWISGTHGFFTVWRGMAAMAFREAFYTGGYLGLAPVLTTKLSEMPGRQDAQLANSLGGAVLAGVVSALITHPADTAKTVYQADIDGHRFTSALNAVPKLYAEGGIRAFYRGGLARTIRLCGAFFVVGSLREAAIGYKSNQLYD